MSALATAAPATVDPSVRANVTTSRRQVTLLTGAEHPTCRLDGHGVSRKGGDDKLERDWSSHVSDGNRRAGEAECLGEGNACWGSR